MPKKPAKVRRVSPNAAAKPKSALKPEVGALVPKRPNPRRSPARSDGAYPDFDEIWRPEDAIVAEGPEVLQPSRLAYRDDARGIYLYHGDCLEVMDTLLAKHPGGVFDMIFADPPYFLSNGGITSCLEIAKPEMLSLQSKQH